MDLHFRTHVATPAGSRIIAGTAEVVGIPNRAGWQLRNAYIREGLRYRAADFWELAAVRRYADLPGVHEEITKLWTELRKEPDLPQDEEERPFTLMPTPQQQKVLDYVLAETGKGRSFPGLPEICRYMGWKNRQSARDVLVALAAAGHITRHWIAGRRVFEVNDKVDA